MGRQRSAGFTGFHGVRSPPSPSGLPPAFRASARPRARQTDGAAPLVEHVEHVGFAEVDPHRPAPRSLAVVALEVAIDALRTRPSAARPAPPSPRRDRRTGRRPESDGRRSSGRGRFRSRGRNRLLVPFPHDSQAVERQVGVDVLNERRLRRDDVGEAAGGDARASRPPSSSLMRRTSPSTIPT